MIRFRSSPAFFVLLIAFSAILALPTFAQSSLVAEMAELDLLYIPALALTNQPKVDAARVAEAKFETQWKHFLATSSQAFPGDAEWSKGLDTISKIVAEASAYAAAGALPAIHEALEGVRMTFLDLREKRGIYYYLDTYTRYHSEMEEATAVLATKKAADLTEADLQFAAAMLPRLSAEWAEAEKARLDPELFHFDEAKLVQIRQATEGVRKSIDKLSSALAAQDKVQIYAALNVLKPSFTKAFLLFGKF